MDYALIFIAIAALVAAVCGLVISNLKAQQHNAEAAWHKLDDLHHRGLNAVPAFVAAVGSDEARIAAQGHAEEIAKGTGARPSPLKRALIDVKHAANASAQAQGPRAAAAADDVLVQSIERVYAAAEVDKNFVASAASRAASAKLDDAERAIAREQPIYNNIATIAANAQHSFPALLFVKRLGLTEPEHYESEAAARRAALDWTRTSQPSLAEASPLVMNPQMLWASSMADAMMDDRTDEKRR